MAGQTNSRHARARACVAPWTTALRALLFCGLVLSSAAIAKADLSRIVLGPGEKDGLPPADAEQVVNMKSGEFVPTGKMADNWSAAKSSADGGKVVHAVVQFQQVPDRAQRAALEQLGVQLLSYLPEKAYFAAILKKLKPEELAAAGVQWVGSVLQEDKIPARIAQGGVGSWALRANGTVDLNVRYFDDVLADDAIKELKNIGATILGRVDALRRVTVNVAVSRLEQITALDSIRWVEEVPPPPVRHNDGSRLNTQAGVVQSSPYNLSGNGVVLGIWDGGSVDAEHDDFAGRLTIAEATSVDDHATHVAGTMAGAGTLSVSRGGTPLQWRGMAPSANIISYDFNGDTIAEHNPAINDFGIVLSQNSWGFVVDEFVFNNCSLYGDYSTTAPEYDQIVTGLFGTPITVVFAAGNERDDGDCGLTGGAPDFINYRCLAPPATAKNIISVGAINSDDNSMTTFSSWGPTDDGRIKPDLVAPGCEVGGEGFIKSTLPGDTYGGPGWCGTSMACPAVSGCAALLIEDFRAQNNNLDPLPSTVKALLVHTAGDLNDPTKTFLNKGPDYASGYGRIQIKDAVDQLRGGGFLVGSVADGATNTFPLTVEAGATNVKVTLVWDDPAAAENASVALVNDLDLIVLDPNGTRHFPWTLDPANPSAPAVRTAEDHRNVVEQVLVEGTNVVSGTWTVHVVGRSVAVDSPQEFSLAFTPLGSIPSPQNIEIVATPFSDATGGDGDNFIEDGETVTLNVILTRPSTPSNTITGISAVLTTTTPGITITQANSTYPDLDAGAVVTNDTEFVFTVATNITCGSQIDFTLNLDTDGGSVSLSFTLDVGEAANALEIDFESGLGGIMVNNAAAGLWHLSSGRGLNDGHSSSNSMYYGAGESAVGGGNYDTGTPNAGTFTLPALDLVGLQGRVILTFNHLLEREPSAAANFDVARVQVSRDGGATWVTAGGPYTSTDGRFERATVDLSPFLNHAILVRFSFDTIDHQFNSFEGWYVDDILVRTFECPFDVALPGQIIAQGVTVNDGQGIFNVFDGLSGTTLLTQTVFAVSTHSDFRSAAIDTAGNGIKSIAVAGVKTGGSVEFEIRDGQTGSKLAEGFLDAGAVAPYTIGVADTAGDSGEELIVVATAAGGTVLDLRNPVDGSRYFVTGVLDGSAYADHAIVPIDVDGNGKKEIVIVARRVADGVLVADARDGMSGARLAFFTLGKEMAAPFVAFGADLTGDGLEKLIVLASSSKNSGALGAFDCMTGKSSFTRKVLKSAGSNLQGFAAPILGAGNQIVVAGSNPVTGEAFVEVRNEKGKAVRSHKMHPIIGTPFRAIGANVDGDSNGRYEIVVAATRTDTGTPILAAMDGNTGGSLFVSTPFDPVAVSGVDVFATDVDGDGTSEVVASATRTSDSQIVFEVRAGVSGALISGFGPGSNFAAPLQAFGAHVGD